MSDCPLHCATSLGEDFNGFGIASGTNPSDSPARFHRLTMVDLPDSVGPAAVAAFPAGFATAFTFTLPLVLSLPLSLMTLPADKETAED